MMFAIAGCDGLAAAPMKQSIGAVRRASAATSTSAVTVHRIDPSTTSPTVGAPNDPNVAVVDDAVRSNGELFVFFPGTGGQPDCCTDLLESAAEAGFHAVGLTYPNAPAVGTVCRNNLACYATVRQDDFDGSDPNPYVHVAATNAIQARLTDLLRYLSVHYPSERWSPFLADATPTWKHIVVGGHSQGGGDAAYIGKIRDVEGVVMLSSDVDSTSTDPPVAGTYLSTGHLTPLARYVGFDHVRDPFFDKIVADWTALHLQSFGPQVAIDGHRTPFGDTHELVTSAIVPSGPVPALATHDATAVDSQTPRCENGTPAFAPVWRYMLQVAGGFPITSGVPICPAG
jgi:hypothetical protein